MNSQAPMLLTQMSRMAAGWAGLAGNGTPALLMALPGCLPRQPALASLSFRRGATSSVAAQSDSTMPPVMPPADASRKGTADLCDVFMPEPVDTTTTRAVNAVTPGLFKDYGGNKRFSGQVSTVRCFENNPLVRKALGEPGAGRVLVVDGGGSLRCALLGDMLAESGVRNGWSGIIVNGCIRDSEDISTMPLGVKALATHPLKSSKRDPGLRDVPVSFGGVTFRPGDWVYADADGILVSSQELKL